MEEEHDWWYTHEQQEYDEDSTEVRPLETWIPKVRNSFGHGFHPHLDINNGDARIIGDWEQIHLLHPESPMLPMFTDARNLNHQIPEFVMDDILDDYDEFPGSGSTMETSFPGSQNFTRSTSAELPQQIFHSSKVKLSQNESDEDDSKPIERLHPESLQFTKERLYETSIASDDHLDPILLQKPPPPKQEYTDEKLVMCEDEKFTLTFDNRNEQLSKSIHGFANEPIHPDSEHLGEPSNQNQDSEEKSSTMNSESGSPEHQNSHTSNESASTSSSKSVNGTSSENSNGMPSVDVVHSENATNGNPEDVPLLNYDYGTPQSYHSSTIGSLPPTPEHLEAPPPIEEGDELDGPDSEDDRGKEDEEEPEKHTVDETGQDIIPPIVAPVAPTIQIGPSNPRKRPHSPDDKEHAKEPKND